MTEELSKTGQDIVAATKEAKNGEGVGQGVEEKEKLGGGGDIAAMIKEAMRKKIEEVRGGEQLLAEEGVAPLTLGPEADAEVHKAAGVLTEWHKAVGAEAATAELPEVQGEDEQTRAKSALQNLVDWLDADQGKRDTDLVFTELLSAYDRAEAKIVALEQALRSKQDEVQQLGAALVQENEKYAELQWRYAALEKKYADLQTAYGVLQEQLNILLGAAASSVKVKKI